MKALADAKNADANTAQTIQQTKINEPDEETSKALKWWNSTWAGKAINVAGDIMHRLSPFTSSAVNYVSARQVRKGLENKPNTETVTHYNSKGKETGSTIKRQYKD